MTHSDKPRFSVVFSTYNRKALLERALESVVSQSRPDLEVIAIDDASSDGTEVHVRARFPSVRYFRQETNQGPGPARNRGLREATGKWVLIGDDDDTFLPGAFDLLESAIGGFPDAERYPVLQFAHANGRLPSPFHLVDLDGYLGGALVGDFTPVICRELFLSRGYAYPNTRIGGEHLLWWRIAKETGIPSWMVHLQELHHDAPNRLTSTEHQVRRAAEFAALQEETLEEFGQVLDSRYPALAKTKRLGAVTYHLLAGNTGRARELARLHLAGPTRLATGVLSHLPLPLTRALFRRYRALQARRARTTQSAT